MKNVLITAKSSYIGKAFAEWTRDKYDIDFISCRTNDWEKEDFSKYHSILHVAGIAHVSTDPSMEAEYYRINRDLTIKLAEKAKGEGVKQFIFMSSIIVYGESSLQKKVINQNTIPKPSDFYGNSKLQAEEGLKILESEDFKVAVIRPPMIYGKKSKGNYPKLAKAARVLPVFPNFDNERSMLHIDNLSEFLRPIVDNEERGLFFPQNRDYVKTSEMVRIIAEAHGKKIRLSRIFNGMLKLMMGKVNIVNKVFGNLVYDKTISSYKEEYQVKDLKESIEVTEK